MEEQKENQQPGRIPYRFEKGQAGSPDTIVLDAPADRPALDPTSEEFDMEQWQDVLKTLDTAELQALIQECTTRMLGEANELLNASDIVTMQYLVEHTKEVQQARGTSEDDLDAAMVSSFHVQKDWDGSVQGVMELITPAFWERLLDTVKQLAGELPLEELEALQEEIDALEEERELDPDQLSLFNQWFDEGFDEGMQEDLQQSELPKKPRRKPKTHLTQLVEKGVEKILQNRVTNVLTKAGGNKVKVNQITGAAEIVYSGNVIARLSHYKELSDIGSSAWILLDALTIKLTENPRKANEKTVRLTLDEYMQRRGLKDRKEAKRQVIADMKILQDVSVSLEEKQGTTSFRFANLADSGSVERNGDIVISFGDAFHQVLINGQIMPYYTELNRLNAHKFPNAYYMGRKILEQKNMNALKSTAGDIISVKTLLESAPFIPDHDTVAATDRAFTRRIINPFERDLSALKEIFTWEYCHENGKPLTDSEIETFSYDVFITCNVKVSLQNYPDQTKRREAQEARKAKALPADGQKKKRGRPRKNPVN